MRRSLSLAYLLAVCISGFSQSEAVVSLETGNTLRLKSEEKETTVLKQLPFFDDFAYPYTTPLPSLWQDDDAYVNSAFAKNMITIGVASLDAMDSQGRLHQNVGVTASLADFLTSRPLNLKTYETIYYSDNLLHKAGSSLSLLDDNYYLYDSDSKKYLPVSQRLAFKPGDTLYKKADNSFVAVQDSLFDASKAYIKGSYDWKRQWKTYSLADSLALSFAYQSGGFVDCPEKTDSLVLEWYAPYDTAGIFLNEMSAGGVEVYNATDSTVSLAGYFLVFGDIEHIIAADSLHYYMMQDVVAEPYQFAVATPEMFGKESFSTARAFLYSPDTVLVDKITVGESLGNGVAYARMPDGNPAWTFAAESTLGECNPGWQWMWSTSKATGNEFQQVFIPVESKRFLVKGFRFRFKNYASLSNDESHARNEDFWHIDMVWLDANRTAQMVNVPDVAFASDFSPLYSRYKALPMAHFANVSNADFRMTIPATFTNFDNVFRKLKFHLSIHKEHTGDAVEFPTYETDMPPLTTVTERDYLSDFDIDFFDFLAEDLGVEDEGKYVFKYYYTDINNAINSQYRWNDTCRTTLTLADFYAYDDGTPEAGYGLREAPMGRVAYRFDMLQPDTLRSIAMYFNPTKLETATTFNLCVWENSDGLPGKLLYYSPSEKVQHADGMFQFVDYEIKPECITAGTGQLLLPKSYFIGWEQPHDVLLNIGIDLNTTATKRLFYNLGFEWESSVQNGALLMRPVVGKWQPKTAAEALGRQPVAVYPSVASGYVSVASAEPLRSVEVFDAKGTRRLATAGSFFSVASLANGIYLVAVTTTGGSRSLHKIIVEK